MVTGHFGTWTVRHQKTGAEKPKCPDTSAPKFFVARVSRVHSLNAGRLRPSAPKAKVKVKVKVSVLCSLQTGAELFWFLTIKTRQDKTHSENEVSIHKAGPVCSRLLFTNSVFILQ